MRALSGQDLVPVAELDGEIVVDSMVIVERPEVLAPAPPLYPSDPAARAMTDVCRGSTASGRRRRTRWPMSSTARSRPSRVVELGGLISARLQIFEDLLAGGDFLLGDRLSAADVCAFPFLKYALLHDPEDTETFHRALMEHQPLGDSHRGCAHGSSGSTRFLARKWLVGVVRPHSLHPPDVRRASQSNDGPMQTLLTQSSSPPGCRTPSAASRIRPRPRPRARRQPDA